MDLNYLYHRRGFSALMARNAGCPRSREAHLTLAESYDERIAEAKRELRAIAA